MSQDSEINTMGGCLARLFWIILGPAFLLVFSLVIASSQPAAIPGVLDIIYGGLLVIIIFARLLDLPPKAKAEEYKVGMDSALKYISVLSFSAIGLWLLVHFVISRII
ncbi:MAG TPA: hypothetical protein VJC37_06635 [Planctomycetota bacterium]|nr:hypothetical protein [Planctomycetota bacterium]